MQTPKPSLALRLFPSLTDAAFIMPLVFLYVRLEGAKTMLGDGDTGWHVRTGEWILRNGRVPDKDIFSFTKASEPWYAWEWLWDVVFGWMHLHWGMAAVVIASSLVLSVTFALLFRLARRVSGNDVIAILVTFLATIGSAMHWLARPHLFTLLFVVVFCSLIERIQAGRTRLLWILPALTVLWTNLHGGFLAGVLILAAYAAGELVAALTDRDAGLRRAALGRAGRYVLTAGACLAASLVNPYGYHLHQHVYKYLGDPFLYKNISEFLGMNFQEAGAIYWEIMLLAAAVAAFWSIARRRFAEAFLLIGWAHLALFSARNLPIFMIVSAPVVAWAAAELLERLRGADIAPWIGRAINRFNDVCAEFGGMDRMWRVHLASAAAALALIPAFYAAAAPPRFRAEYDAKRYPVRALELLRSPDLAQGVFADDEWGDYLIYRLQPAFKVFVDGRSDFYGAKFDQKFLDILGVKHGWQDTLNRYGVTAALLRTDSSLAGALKESSRWRPVYDDGQAILFRAAAVPGGETASTCTTAVERAVIARSQAPNISIEEVRKGGRHVESAQEPLAR